MTDRYASKTTVPAEQSRGEIERTLQRYGASSFGYGWNVQGAIVTFEAHGRRIRFLLPMPDPEADEFNVYMRGTVRYRREDSAARKLWEQATRQRWRALALVVKAKLEAVESGLTTFEDEFLAHTLVPGPNGDVVTVSDLMQSQVDEAYKSGAIPGGLMLALPAGAGA